MPAPLEVDREQVRLVAVQIGVREAARQFDLPEETVKTWSGRYGWFKEKQQEQQLVTVARERKRESQGLSPREPKASEILEKYGKQTRLALAKGLAKGAETVADMDGQEVLMSAAQIKQLTGAAKDVHGWAQTVEHKLSLDVLASGQAQEHPVLDVAAEILTEELDQ